MSDHLTLGSLFSGSGGFELGGILAGIEPIWNAEIEPFPIRVTTKRLPQVRHFGDVSSLDGATMPPVDVITFGSPCQDMSLAGRRAGLDGERSVLFYQAIRIVREMREATHGEKPRFIVWENVPGAFSSNGGQDFKAVLEAVIHIKEPSAAVPSPEKGRWRYADLFLGDGWSVAYRVLDAQYWGVAQRRRRVFLVADFGSERAGDILFERKSLQGHPGKGETPRTGASGDTEDGTGADGVWCLSPQGSSDVYLTRNKAGTLVAQDHGHHPAVLAAGFSTGDSASARSIGYGEEVSPTLRTGAVPAALFFDNHPQDSRCNGPLPVAGTVSAQYGTGGNNQPLVLTQDADEDVYTLKIRCGKEGGGKGALWQTEKSFTLATNNDQTLFVPRAFGIGAYNSLAWLSENPRAGIYEADKARTLDQSGGNPSAQQGGMAIVDTFAMTVGDFMQIEKEMTPPLMARDYKDPIVVNEPEVPRPYRVRRLMPLECGRLQGFPDGWCDDLGTDEPDDEDIAFWTDVFETHRRIVTHSGKPKTEKQLVRWLKQPHTDSAEYRMWGNGVALPCVFFVMAGIAKLNEDERHDGLKKP